MKKTYDQKLAQIQCWVDIINHHWLRLKGVLNNDKDFWADTLHSMVTEDFWDLVDVSEVLVRQHPELFRQRQKFQENIELITKRLHKGQAVVKQYAVSHNYPVFQVMMEIKDVINDINGTPTTQYTKREQEQKTKQSPEEQTQFERLFDFQ